VLAGYIAARRELKRLAPALLFSKGGYVSVPPCAAAASLGIPYFTHESDLTPGLATRLNAKKAEHIVISYEATRALLPEAVRGRAVVAGNPVRAEISRGDRAKGRSLLGLDKDPSLRDLPVIFFLGGSQGARQVNQLVAESLSRLTEKAFVLHQGGPGASSAAGSENTRYRFYQYIREEMPDLLASADLVVGRSGASTLWESSALAKPMLLVPLCGSGTRGDQVDNAEFFVRSGAAISLVGNKATADALVAEALKLVGDAKKLAEMGQAAAALAGGNAASEIADLILHKIGEAP
jgi:UDP-N-acetylglucosamine--N-acetylmuramyl-(pentapeptide) pyrophosphoryl-undecaprenol N-acetylglucosamine transferase